MSESSSWSEPSKDCFKLGGGRYCVWDTYRLYAFLSRLPRSARVRVEGYTIYTPLSISVIRRRQAGRRDGSAEWRELVPPRLFPEP